MPELTKTPSSFNLPKVEVSWYWIALFFIALSVLWFYGMHLTNEQLALGAV